MRNMEMTAMVNRNHPGIIAGGGGGIGAIFLFII